MNIQKFSRQEIALRQIETALELFARQGELFSVITLAGAAEEILKELVALKKGGGGGGGVLRSLFNILRPAAGKDREPGLSGHEIDDLVHMDPLHEAVFLLTRAIREYVELTGVPTQAMLKFLSEQAQA